MKEFVTLANYLPIIGTFSCYFDKDGENKSIKSMLEFVNSSCDLLVCVVDSEEIIVLSKDSSILTNFLEKCIKCNFTNVKHIDTKRTF